MDKDVMPLPRSAGPVLVGLTIAAFCLSVLVPVMFPDQQNLTSVPLVLVAALWAIPLMLALLRGEPWAFILGLALLMFATDASFRARTWADKSVDAQVVFRGLVWAGCGLVGMLRLAHTAWMFGRPPVIFALFLLAVMMASAAWSPTPMYTLQSAIAYFWMFLFGLAAAEILDERDLLLAMAVGCGLIVLPSLAIAPFAMGVAPSSPGSTGTADRLRGLTDHPIPLAEVSALFTFACAALWARRPPGAGRLGLGILALAGAITAALTQSRLPPMAMLAAALGFWAYRRGGWMLMLPTITLCGVLVLSMESIGGFANLLPQDVLELVSRSGQSGEILSMSGRMDIWPYVLDRIAASPVLGYGYASGMDLFKGFTRWKITHAHNMYLQTLLYTGLIGFSMLVGLLVSQLRLFFAKPQPVRDILLLYMMLKGITEQSVMSNMPSGTVALWFVIVGMAAMAWRHKPQDATVPT